MSKKKITSFLVLLAALFMSSSAFAQLAEIRGKAIYPGTAVTEIQENTWYLLYQARVLNTDVDALLQPGEQAGRGGYLWDGASSNNNSILKKAATNLDSNPIIANEDYAAYLVRFLSTGEEDTYNIQFGTGNYLLAPGTANGTNLKSSNNIYDATEFNLYTISDENPAVFGFNVAPYGACIDNNGNGYTVVTWGSGKHTNVEYGNSKWNIVSVDLVEVDPKDAAFQYLQSVYEDYYAYYDAFETGTEPGQYGEAEVAAFRALLDAIAELDGPDGEVQLESMTADDLYQMAEEVEAAYQAILNSLVQLTLPNGYYRIKNGGRTFEETITDEISGTTESVIVDKYMYVAQNGNNLNGVWGGVDDLSTHAPSLWKLTDKGEGKFELINMAFDAQFNKSSGQGSNFTLQTDSTELMYIRTSPLENDGTHSYINIRVASQTANNLWLHLGGHGNGTGKNGNVIAYYNTDIASEWELISVTDEDAQAIIDAYAPIKDREAMLAAYDSIMTNAKANLEIAYDLKKNVDYDDPLITSNDQFSSPYEESYENEGNTVDLLDGQTSTYWHSAWAGGAVAMDFHYLQVEVNDVDVNSLVAVIGRRTVNNDHATVMNVRGTNDPEAEKDDCELLATINTPFGGTGELGVVSNVFEPKGYKYLRFYPVTTYGLDAAGNNRGYFHFAEFQLYPAEAYQSETAQSIMLGELYTNLENVVNEQAELETDDIQLEQYNALKEAYDAFMAKFVDPTELRNTMASVKDVLATVRAGSNPGFWSNEEAGNAFKATYDAAEAYDKGGVYTQEKSDNYVETLNQQSKDIYASANKIQEGKWYRIHFPAEGDYEEFGWDKAGAKANLRGETDEETVPALFNKYLAVANLDVENSEDADGAYTVQSIVAVDPETVAVGHTLHVMDENEMESYPDNALFRFIAVGDSAYMMQNKGTGLFVKATGTTGQVILSAHPTLFNVNAIGYGVNTIAAKDLTGNKQNYLHIQKVNNMLVTWNAYTVGSNSALYIEEAESVADNYDGSAFNLAVSFGSVSMHCFPVGISLAEGSDAQMWTVGEVTTSSDSLAWSVSLAPIEKVAGGRPFILVYGDTENYEADEEGDLVAFTHDNIIGHTVPETNHPLIGTYSSKTLVPGNVVADGNALVVNKRSNLSIPANSAYIKLADSVSPNATIEVIFNENGVDGIQAALQNVAKSGAVYTIDGRLVSKKANLNDLQKFGKGVYILNGTKVVVK